MRKYPRLSNLINGCLHQDYDLIGDSLDEIIAYYVGCCTVDELCQLRKDIVDFRRDHADQLESAFDDAYVDFDPKLWESSVDDFFNRVDRAAKSALDVAVDQKGDK